MDIDDHPNTPLLLVNLSILRYAGVRKAASKLKQRLYGYPMTINLSTTDLSALIDALQTTSEDAITITATGPGKEALKTALESVLTHFAGGIYCHEFPFRFAIDHSWRKYPHIPMVRMPGYFNQLIESLKAQNAHLCWVSKDLFSQAVGWYDYGTISLFASENVEASELILEQYKDCESVQAPAWLIQDIVDLCQLMMRREANDLADALYSDLSNKNPDVTFTRLERQFAR